MLNIIKIGSACLFDKQGQVNYNLLRRKSQEIEQSEDNTVLVVSGAIALGKAHEREKRNNSQLTAVELQGYACVGQPRLMNLYQELFNLNVSQLLVTRTDLQQENHVRSLIHHNVQKQRITVVNYNDAVDFEQLRQDNDTLAATILSYCNADRLIILGHYDGFKDGERLMSHVTDINDFLYSLCRGKSEHGNGGFNTKLDAAKIVLHAGKEMIVGNIAYDLEDIISGQAPRTLFKNH